MKNKLSLRLLLILIITSCSPKKTPEYYILDLVHHNPGEGETTSKFNNPEFIKNKDYNGMVVMWNANCAITYDNFEQDIVPKQSDEYRWIEEKARWIDQKLAACDKAGMDVYSFTDVFVAPQSIWHKYGDKMGGSNNKHGAYGGSLDNVRNPSVQKELIQELIRAQVDGLFERFPSLDGLVIRFGETYLHDTPFHLGGRLVREGPEGIQDHILLLNILRDEVCVKWNKKLFYRTWDFGWLHTKPDVYLSITDQIAPHPNLVFSIKHTKGDFHRDKAFNPTLGIGKHKQIVEVQCQREYEGKGAHPNYIGEAVINHFIENKDRDGINGLSELKNHPNFSGVWTWSRGGGWKGPYISNELWCELNAYVISQWTLAKNKSEESIFYDFCKMKGLTEQDAEMFRKIAIYSNLGVYKGKVSALSSINPAWIRDQFIGGIAVPDEKGNLTKTWGNLNKGFNKIIQKGLVDKIIEEKEEAVHLWLEIENLASKINSGDDDFRNYLQVSSSYGRIKYDIICQGWTIMLLGMEGDKRGTYDQTTILEAKAKYDALWGEFKALHASNKQCASLYLPYSFSLNNDALHGEAGMDKAVAYYADKATQQIDKK